MAAAFVLVIWGNVAIVRGSDRNDGITERTTQNEEEIITYHYGSGVGGGVYTESDSDYGGPKKQTNAAGEPAETGSVFGQKRRQKFLHRKKYKRYFNHEEEEEKRRGETKTDNRSDDKEVDEKRYDRESLSTDDVSYKEVVYKKVKNDNSKFKRNFFEFSSSDKFLTVTSSSYPPSAGRRQQQRDERKQLKPINDQGNLFFEDYTNDSPDVNDANPKCGDSNANRNGGGVSDNAVIRASVILPSDSESYELSLSRVLPVLHLAEAAAHRTGLLPKHLYFEFIVSDDHCDAVYAQIGTFNAIKRNVHVFFGPACEYSVGK